MSRYLNRSQIDFVLEKVKSGWPQKRIADVVGCSESAVYWQVRKHGVDRPQPLPPKWEPSEDDVLRRVWGRLSREQYKVALPGRSYSAIMAHAQRIGVKAPVRRMKLVGRNDPARTRAHRWNVEEIEKLMRLGSEREAWPTAFPGRTKRAIENMAQRLGFAGTQRTGPRYSSGEMRRLHTIVDAKRKLLQTRSAKSIADKLRKMTEHEAQQDAIIGAVRKAVPAGLPQHVRDEVQQTLLVQILSRETKIADLAAAAKKAITKTYGRRMFSLDAPLSDGSSMTWIDTIDNDHARF